MAYPLIFSIPPRRCLQALGLVAALASATPASAQDCLMGELRLFAGNFAPRNWQLAAGQILPIAQNAALFTILGTTYGGNGMQNFALPDLRGRTAVGVGQGPGLSYWGLGESRGTETQVLNANHLPAHGHTVNVASNAAATTGTPGSDKVLAVAQNAGLYATAATPTVPLHGATVGMAGGTQPFAIQPPSLGMNYMICVAGIFPQRP